MGVIDFMKSLLLLIKRLRTNEAGVALLEFAIALPVLLTLFIAGSEIIRGYIIYQRLEKTAWSAADTVAQINTQTMATLATASGSAPTVIFTSYMNAVFGATQSMMGVYGTTNVLISDYANQGAGVIQNWKCITAGAGNATRITTAGTSLSFPNGVALTLNVGDGIIVAEAFYSYSPVIANNFMSPYTFYSLEHHALHAATGPRGHYSTSLASFGTSASGANFTCSP